MALLDDVNRALRANSPELLEDALRRFLRAQPVPLPDWRDVLVGLAPIYDCAKRLGVDQVAMFDRASQDSPSEVTDHVRRFARRTDITPAAFDFVVDEDGYGATYRWGPGWR